MNGFKKWKLAVLALVCAKRQSLVLASHPELFRIERSMFAV